MCHAIRDDPRGDVTCCAIKGSENQSVFALCTRVTDLCHSGLLAPRGVPTSDDRGNMRLRFDSTRLLPKINATVFPQIALIDLSTSPTFSWVRNDGFSGPEEQNRSSTCRCPGSTHGRFAGGFGTIGHFDDAADLGANSSLRTSSIPGQRNVSLRSRCCIVWPQSRRPIEGEIAPLGAN